MKFDNTRYQPVDDGYRIIGSREIFNRSLYGSHKNDDQTIFGKLAKDDSGRSGKFLRDGRTADRAI